MTRPQALEQPTELERLLKAIKDSATDPSKTGEAQLIILSAENDQALTALINGADREGNTPMHVAASVGNVDLVNFLLTYRPNLGATNVFARSPLDIASEAMTRREGNMADQARYLSVTQAIEHAMRRDLGARAAPSPDVPPAPSRSAARLRGAVAQTDGAGRRIGDLDLPHPGIGVDFLRDRRSSRTATPTEAPSPAPTPAVPRAAASPFDTAPIPPPNARMPGGPPRGGRTG